jgi:predicted GNAT family acetyltransferase
MNEASKPSMPRPPDAEITEVMGQIAVIFSDLGKDALGLTQANVKERVQKRGHAAAAAEWAIYFAKEKGWLGCTTEQRKKTEQKTRRFVAPAGVEFIDVSVLEPTQEFWAARQSGNLADWRVGLNAPNQTAPGPKTSGEGLPAVTTVPQARIVYTLHGILTLAEWQKRFSDVAFVYHWKCRLERWSFGRFSLLAFLNPWAREAKLEWFRKQYEAEANDKDVGIDTEHAPSIVAHSFGTYILGYSLLRFDFIRFNKVIVCGSILPVGFPWDKLIARGQVQAVRNEFGVRDFWVRCAGSFVKGAGPSGAEGFTCNHERLVQEKFDY